jgi:hypothetical protein
MFTALLVAFGCSTLLSAQSASSSSAVAHDLVQAMQAASLDAFAAADAAEPGRYVAVLVVGDQLLVVSAAHPSKVAIEGRIGASQYRDVYLDLSGTPNPAGKLFVQDAKSDGLQNAERNSGTVDVVYENGSQTTLFNGDPESQHLSGKDYEARYAALDAKYAHALTVLKMALATRGAKT